MDQAVAKRTLQELIKNEELDNKHCVDCGNPNPQWASLSFAVFLCLQCAGVHRGFGVHISFVRSVSMDTWQEEQVKRMQLGGNGPFKKFMKSYDNGGYTEGMNPYDTYHSWAASQYREKLDANLAGKPWSPSPKPAGTTSPGGSMSPPGRPSSAQGLRKSRASTRNNTGRSASPASFNSSPASTPNPTTGAFPDQKAANESFFATLGQANATRSADLPPSQGGKYQGFGNTPAPSSNPAYGLSSAAVPSLSDLQENPMGALSKGWSFFSSAVVGASRAVSENVIQPGMEKVMDPTFQAGVRGYVKEAASRAGEVGRSANAWTKNTIGVDVAEQVGGVVGTVRDKIGGGPQRNGYGAIQSSYEGESAGLYQDHEDDDDFFEQYNSGSGAQQSSLHSPEPQSSLASRSAPAPKKADDWDDWKEF